MILDIKTYPDKILTKKTRPIREFDANLQKLIDDMAETLYAKHGAGLAANQVGESTQIIVVDGGEGLKVLINPKLTRSRGQMIYAEGCLSFPGIELFIKRPTKIAVAYQDQKGEKCFFEHRRLVDTNPRLSIILLIILNIFVAVGGYLLGRIKF